MADNEENTGRTVRVYERPADADKPRSNPRLPALIVAAVVVGALLVAKFVFHVHFGLGHLLHLG